MEEKRKKPYAEAGQQEFVKCVAFNDFFDGWMVVQTKFKFVCSLLKKTC